MAHLILLYPARCEELCKRLAGNATNKANFRELTYENCFHGPRFKTRDQFEENGVTLTPAAWFRLQLAVTTTGRRLENRNAATDKIVTIESFFKKLKRGSKNIHSYFRLQYFNEKELITEPIVITYGRLTNTVPVAERNIEILPLENQVPVRIESVTINELKAGLVLWNNYAFENEFREFLLKSRYNILWTNSRLHAAGLRDDPFCTFCKIRFGQTRAHETFVHIFKDCLTTSSLIANVRGENDDINEANFNISYFFGLTLTDQGTVKIDLVKLLFWEIFRYRLWKKRCQRVVPNVLQIRTEISFVLKCIANLNRRWRLRLANSEFVANLYEQQG